MSLQVLDIERSGLISEVPNIVLVVEHLTVEGHDRSVVLGLGQGTAHTLPDVQQAEGLEDTAAANLLFQLVECTVDEALEHRQFLLNLARVLTVEVNNGLHARRLAIDAPALASLLNIEVVVEAAVELVHDGIKTILTQDVASAVGLELLGNKFNGLGNVVFNGAVGIALQVGGL